MNDLMLQVTVVAIAANVVLIVVAVIRSRMMRPERDLATASATVASSEGRTSATARSPALEAAAATSDASAQTSDVRPIDPTPTEPSEPRLANGETPVMSANAEQPIRPRRFAMPDDEDYPSDESVHAFLSSGPGADGPPLDIFDLETGLRTGLAWDEALGHEEARRARYGRPVTVVVAELDRLDALARQLGWENADRLIRPVAQALVVNARASDIIARLGHHRFGVLLPETDEIRAINYVERIRLACDAWLEAAAVAVRLSIGWASAPSGGDLADAYKIAERRMYAERNAATTAPTAIAPGDDPGAPGASDPDPASAPSRPEDVAASFAAWGDARPEADAG